MKKQKKPPAKDRLANTARTRIKNRRRKISRIREQADEEIVRLKDDIAEQLEILKALRVKETP